MLPDATSPLISPSEKPANPEGLMPISFNASKVAISTVKIQG
jgi:hypothetical protein